VLFGDDVEGDTSTPLRSHPHAPHTYDVQTPVSQLVGASPSSLPPPLFPAVTAEREVGEKRVGVRQILPHYMTLAKTMAEREKRKKKNGGGGGGKGRKRGEVDRKRKQEGGRSGSDQPDLPSIHSSPSRSALPFSHTAPLPPTSHFDSSAIHSDLYGVAEGRRQGRLQPLLPSLGDRKGSSKRGANKGGRAAVREAWGAGEERGKADAKKEVKAAWKDEKKREAEAEAKLAASPYRIAHALLSRDDYVRDVVSHSYDRYEEGEERGKVDERDRFTSSLPFLPRPAGAGSNFSTPDHYRMEEAKKEGRKIGEEGRYLPAVLGSEPKVKKPKGDRTKVKAFLSASPYSRSTMPVSAAKSWAAPRRPHPSLL